MDKKRLQRIYSNMKTRCYNPISNRYYRYGGRGIKVCEEWINNFASFKEWALNNGYTDNLCLDRINNDGNYEPLNCRWVTKKQNSNNTIRNRFLTFNEKTHTMSEWCEILGVKLQTLSARIYRGWSVEDAITKSIRKKQIKSLKGEK